MPPDVPGSELAISSNEIFDLAGASRSGCVVVGGGYIAVRVRVDLQRPRRAGDAALPRRPDPARLRRRRAHFVAAEMTKKGVDIRFGAARSRARAAGATAAIARRTRTTAASLEADAVLCATGRAPEHRRARPRSARRRARRRTARSSSTKATRSSVPSIYAIGDVIDRVQLTPVALAEAMALVDDLFGERRAPGRLHARSRPRCSPIRNIGTIGLSEEDARARFERDPRLSHRASSRCATPFRAAASGR